MVLSGGGTKGIYQCGAVSALRKLGKDNWDIITGTSVGALNAAMLVQGDFDIMDQMYEAGIVSKDDGTKARQVLMTPEQFSQFLEEDDLL